MNTTEIKRIRRRLKLTQAELSRFVGVHPVTVSRWERGDLSPRPWAESLLRAWGFAQFRVRDHDGLARIEVGPEELEAALDPAFARAAEEALTAAGFDHVTLDLGGYRTGSVSPGGDALAAPDGPAADAPRGG